MRVLIFLLFFLSVMPAEIIDTITTTASNNKEIDTQLENVDKVMKNIKTEIDKKKQQAIDDKETNKYKYFKDVPNTTVCDPTTFKCPDLTSEYAKTHVVLTDWAKPSTGKIKCSIYPKNDLFGGFEIDKKPRLVYSKVFEIGSCKKSFLPLNNLDKDDKVQQLRIIAKKNEDEFKNLKLNTSYTETQEKYLDLGDWLDALITMDAEKIDIQKSLDLGEISTTANYTVIPNETVLTKFKDALRNLMHQKRRELTQTEVDKLVDESEFENKKNKDIADSSYLMYLDFFARSNAQILHIINVLLVIFLAYNLLINWLGHNAAAKASGMRIDENYIHRSIIGVSALVIFYAGTTDKIELRSDTGEIKTIEVKNQRIQDFVRIAFNFTNSAADELTKNAISSYLNNLKASSGIFDVKMVDSLSSDRKILENENKMLKKQEEICRDTYDISLLKINLQKYRRDVLKQDQVVKQEETFQDIKTRRVGAFSIGDYKFDGLRDNYYQDRKEIFKSSLLDVNPYPATEREARMSLLENKQTPYQKYFIGDQKNSIYSLSACGFTIDKIIKNNQKINQLTEKLNSMRDTSIFQAKIDRIKSVSDIMWKNYDEMGYLSIVFLPATDILIKDNGLLANPDDYLKKQEDEDRFKTVAEKIPELALFGGNQIAEALNSLVGGTFATKGLALIAASSIIEQLLVVAQTVVFIVISIFAFIVLIFSKILIYFALMFIVIYAFHKNQEEKVMAALGQLLKISFKTVILVATIFLALWMYSLMDNLQNLLLNDFFYQMDTYLKVDEVKDASDKWWWESTAEWFQYSFLNFENNAKQYAVYGLTHVAFMIIKIIAVATVIWKVPSYFYSLIDSNYSDFGDRVSDAIEQAAERESMKGL
jgi:hypothetical protein